MCFFRFATHSVRSVFAVKHLAHIIVCSHKWKFKSIRIRRMARVCNVMLMLMVLLYYFLPFLLTSVVKSLFCVCSLSLPFCRSEFFQIVLFRRSYGVFVVFWFFYIYIFLYPNVVFPLSERFGSFVRSFVHSIVRCLTVDRIFSWFHRHSMCLRLAVKVHWVDPNIVMKLNGNSELNIM